MTSTSLGCPRTGSARLRPRDAAPTFLRGEWRETPKIKAFGQRAKTPLALFDVEFPHVRTSRAPVRSALMAHHVPRALRGASVAQQRAAAARARYQPVESAGRPRARVPGSLRRPGNPGQRG